MANSHYRVTWADAVHLHAEALAATGGCDGILNANSVHAALGRPYRGYHRRIHEKAAALLHGFVKNHGFADGNKRTALLLVELMLRRSGYSLDADGPAVLELIVGVADDTVTYDELVIWLRERIARKPAVAATVARKGRS